MSSIVKFDSVNDKILTIHGQDVILDHDVAQLYGVETRIINQAVKNNPNKFPNGYIITLNNEESSALRSKFLTLEQRGGKGTHSKYNYKAFTEKGLYMLATILKGDKAVQTTLAIIEAFAKLRELSRNIHEMTQNPDELKQKSLMRRSGEIVDDLFGDNMHTDETETEIELNFAVLKLKHTIKRKK